MYTLQGINISPKKWHFEDDFPFPKVGYVNHLEGMQINPPSAPLLYSNSYLSNVSNGIVDRPGLPRAGAHDHGGEHSLDAFERQSRKSHRGHRGWLVGWWKPCEYCGVWWCMALMWPLPLESSYFLLDLGGTWKVFEGSSPRGNLSLHELSLIWRDFFRETF